MDYQPREGFDYLVDLYGVVGVSPGDDLGVIKQAINAQAHAYHPDKLQGVAAEFQEKGRRVTDLLNRARTILLNPTKREEYDQLLAEWDGIISTDGMPVMSLEDRLRAEMLSLAPEQLETAFAKQAKATGALVNYNPERQQLFKRLYEAASPQEQPALRKAYDDSLLAEDQVLAIEELERNKLLGLPTNPRYEASLDHVAKTQTAIEQARAKQASDAAKHQLGSVSTRLALLAGDAPASPQELVPQYALVDHFNAQTERLMELAQKRQAVLQERLDMFKPVYPIAEQQVAAQPNFVVGIQISADAQPQLVWFNFAFDSHARQLTNLEVPANIAQALDRQDFADVYNNGYNLLVFEPHEHIDLTLLIEEACNKHIQQYFAHD